MPMDGDRQMQHSASDRLQRPTCHTYNHSGYGKYTESSTAECLRASGGDLGGQRKHRPCPSWSKTGALCAVDYKWVQSQQVMEGKIIPCLVSVEKDAETSDLCDS